MADDDPKEAILRFFKEMHENSTEALLIARQALQVTMATNAQVHEIGRRLFGEKARPQASTGIAAVMPRTPKEWAQVRRVVKDLRDLFA